MALVNQLHLISLLKSNPKIRIANFSRWTRGLESIEYLRSSVVYLSTVMNKPGWGSFLVLSESNGMKINSRLVQSIAASRFAFACIALRLSPSLIWFDARRNRTRVL